MPCYTPGWRNDAFLQSLEEAAAAMGRKWDHRFVVYGIFDPTQRDPARQYTQGLPIYVGQTCTISNRMRGHFNKAESARRRHYCVREQLAWILEQQIVPIFVILGCFEKRLEMLKAETMWAQKMHHDGYKLANRHKDQRSRMQTVGLAKALKSKLSWIPIVEAIATGVEVVAICPKCHGRLAIDLQAKVNALTTEAPAKAPTMGRVLSKSTFCEACGKKMAYHVDDEVDPNQLAPGFEIRARKPAADAGAAKRKSWRERKRLRLEKRNQKERSEL